MDLCIIYLASPTKWSVLSGVRRYEALKYSLTTVRPMFPNTPIYVFHEDYTEEDKTGLSFAVNDFFKIDFSGFDDVYKRVNAPKGYMMMCRFFSGVLQSHPALQKHTHYIRFDDDSYLLAPFLTESRIHSHTGSVDYVYRSVYYENKSQQTLFEFTIDFLKRKGMSELDIFALKTQLRKENILRGDAYTGKAPYNNFHLSSLRLWSHPIVKQYIETIESIHGCLTHGWLDSNIHAMIIWVLAKRYKEIIVRIDLEFGYRHNIHVSLLQSENVLIGNTLSFVPNKDDDGLVYSLYKLKL